MKPAKQLDSSWHLTSTLRETIFAMDRSKTRREKAIEENLAAQIAELKGDLSDKDLMDIAKSARCVWPRVADLTEWLFVLIKGAYSLTDLALRVRVQCILKA